MDQLNARVRTTAHKIRPDPETGESTHSIKISSKPLEKIMRKKYFGGFFSHSNYHQTAIKL